jgi:hypothetical protein
VCGGERDGSQEEELERTLSSISFRGTAPDAKEGIAASRRRDRLTE